MLRITLLAIFSLFAATLAAAPNIVILFADDLGYGDLGAYGHPTIATPNLDRMAAEGQRWTSFYTAASVCTPSRAGLLTGRHPLRSGMMGDSPRVLAERSLSGLPAEEVTIAEMLKKQGYATGMVGKWHLGHMPGFLPTRQGFDSYYGLVSSNDHNKTYDSLLGRYPAFHPKREFWDIPLMEDEEVVEKPADQTKLTKNYTERAVKYIQSNKSRSFFLYLAYTMPHTPLFRSPEFEGRSRRGRYGDVIEEIDWSVGKVLEALRSEGLAENTLVLFTSDNGPWLIFDQNGGSAGLLRNGKGGTWEGGMRVPAIFWWPGKIQPAVVRDIGSTLDVMPTVASLSGAELPSDRPYDGYDLSGALVRGEKSPREEVFYYRGSTLFAVRIGPWKAHFWTQTGYTEPQPTRHQIPALYQLDHDPSEKYEISAAHPEILERITARVERHLKEFKHGENQLGKQSDGPVGVFTHAPK